MDKSRLFERSRSEMRTTAELDIVLVLKANRSTRCLGVAGNDLCYLDAGAARVIISDRKHG
jgi:hypothetical protein